MDDDSEISEAFVRKVDVGCNRHRESEIPPVRQSNTQSMEDREKSYLEKAKAAYIKAKVKYHHAGLRLSSPMET
eukprot:766801-Hanusia_phi.AAC.3